MHARTTRNSKEARMSREHERLSAEEKGKAPMIEQQEENQQEQTVT